MKKTQGGSEMTAAEKWNMIVEIYDARLNVKEEVVQSVWERIFAELLGYSSFAGEIESHRKIQIGSTERVIPDIIMKDGGTDLFVVELKQHNLPLNKGIEKQLLSYLKLLRNDTGVLICDKIYIYAYDNSKSDDEQNRAEIEFRQDNPDGIRFVELFGKSAFKKPDITEFVRRQNAFAGNVSLIKKELDADLIMALLRDYFASSYSAAEFEQAIQDVRITVMPKDMPANLPGSHIASAGAPSEIKVGKAAKTLLREALESGAAADGEIQLMQTKEYSKSVFGINFPLLVSACGECDPVRYYKTPLMIEGVSYRLCSQWFSNNRSHLMKWLEDRDPQ